MMLRALIYLAAGVALLYIPWTNVWTDNFFVVHSTWISALAQNDFFRGAISGIGLADIWLAYEELMQWGRGAEKSHKA